MRDLVLGPLHKRYIFFYVTVRHLTERIAESQLVGSAIVHAHAAKAIAVGDDDIARMNLPYIAALDFFGCLDVAITEVEIVVHGVQGHKAMCQTDPSLVLGMLDGIRQKDFGAGKIELGVLGSWMVTHRVLPRLQSGRSMSFYITLVNSKQDEFRG
jgi:hypothetical protein